MMELAVRHGQGPVSVETIAGSQQLSEKYTHQLMAGLKFKGLVRSVRGARGGYALTRDPATITALDVVAALEDGLAPVECVDDPGACPRSGRCPTREVWLAVNRAVAEVLSGIQLDQLAARHVAETDEGQNYCI